VLQIANLPVTIVWKNFNVGSSIFIPCIDRDAVESYVSEQCRRMSMVVVSKQVIHKKMYGVIFWRTK
jgi:hypothetical protein